MRGGESRIDEGGWQKIKLMVDDRNMEGEKREDMDILKISLSSSEKSNISPGHLEGSKEEASLQKRTAMDTVSDRGTQITSRTRS